MVGRLPYLLVWIYVFTVPWQNSIVLHGLGSIARVAGIAAVAAVILTVLVRERVRAPQPVLMLLSVFVFYSGLSILWSINVAASVSRSLTYLQLLIAAWAVWEAGRDAVTLRGLLQAYVLGACVASVGVLASFVTGATPYAARYVAPGFDPNDLGLTLALGFPIATFLIMHTSSRVLKLFNFLYLVSVLPVIMLTASRTAVVIVTLEILLSPLIVRTARRWLQMLPAGALGLVVVTIAVARVVPSTSLARIATLPSETFSGTLDYRTVIWQAGWAAWKQRPIVGLGPDGFRYAIESTYGAPVVAHNTPLGLMVDGGLVGLLVFASAVVAVVSGLRLTGTSERVLWAAVLGGWLIGSMMLSWESHKVTWLMLSLAACQARIGARNAA